MLYKKKMVKDKLNKKDVGFIDDLVYGLKNIISAEDHTSLSFALSKDEKWLEATDILRKMRSKWMDVLVKKDNEMLWCVTKHLLAVSMSLEEISNRYISMGMKEQSLEAIKDSGWQPANEEQKERTGVLIGSGIGGFSNMEQVTRTLVEFGPKRISPFFVPSVLINMATGWVTIKHGFKGPSNSVVTACATGAHAVGEAAKTIMDESKKKRRTISKIGKGLLKQG